MPLGRAGGGVGLAAFGVGADDDAFEAITLSSVAGFGASHLRSMSIVPSMLEIAVLVAIVAEGDLVAGGRADGAGVGLDGAGDC